MKDLEKDFTKKAREQAQTAMLAYGCATKRLLGDLEVYGGVKTAQSLVQRHRLSDGFEFLRQKGQLQLSLEALVVQGKYGSLFTDDEVNWCLQALCEAGFY